MELNKIKYLIVRIYSLLFMGIISSSTIAQENKLTRKQVLHEFVFKSNHIGLESSGISVFKARLNNQSGTHPVKSSMAPGLALGIKYQFNFSNEYGVTIGPEVIVAGRNFITSFNKNDFSPALTEDAEINATNGYLADLILSFSATIEKRILYKPAKYLFFNSGLRFNISTGADLAIFRIVLPNTNNGFYDAGGVDVYANNDAKPWISIPLNAGHSWLLKNNNLLQLSLCSNVSFTKYVNGTYRIDIPGRISTTGLYNTTGSYIGLSLNYVFTSTNYKIRKAYETN